MFEPALAGTLKLYSQEKCCLTFLDISNPGTVASFVQIFDASAIANVTLGTDVPKLCIAVEKGASATDVKTKSIQFTEPVQFNKGVVMAATTTPTGSTTVVAALGVNFELDRNIRR